MEVEVLDTINDKKLTSPITLHITFKVVPPDLRTNVAKNVLPLKLKLTLKTYGDLILLSRLLYRRYVDSIEAVDVTGKEPVELTEAIRHSYLPLTLRYYYDVWNDRIVYVQVDGRALITKTVCTHVLTKVNYYIEHGMYPTDINPKMEVLLDKVRYIVK